MAKKQSLMDKAKHALHLDEPSEDQPQEPIQQDKVSEILGGVEQDEFVIPQKQEIQQHPKFDKFKNSKGDK